MGAFVAAVYFLGWRPGLLLLALGGTVSAAMFFYHGAAVSGIAPSENRPLEARSDGYVSSDACRACHPREYEAWHHSYHRSMTQRAGPSTVRGDFDQVELSLYGIDYRLSEQDDKFWIHARNPESAQQSSDEVVMTTGSHHFQAYWTESGTGRKLELFPFIFQLAEQRWIPFDSLVVSPPGLQQLSGEGGEWNRVCIHCHASGPEPRALDLARIDSQAAEFGIACESCHGPGEEHVRLSRSPLRRYGLHFGSAPDQSIINPARLEALSSAQVCGQCHAVQDYPNELYENWLENGPSYRPGGDLFLDRVELKEDIQSEYGHTRFWPDGHVRVGGREYPGVLASPCFEGGDFDCTSCHRLHAAADDPRPLSAWADDQLHTGMRGNSACVQCHAEFEREDTLEEHTHHLANSTGSRCYNCHMPHTAFGLHKATRAHRITSPSVQTSLETGRPNACNQCHLDRTLAWTAEQLETWWKIPAPQMSEREREVAATVIWALAGEANQRALAAWTMGWDAALEASGTPREPNSGSGESKPDESNSDTADWVIPYLAQLLVDPYPVVRSVAHRSLVRHPGFEDFEFEAITAGPAAEASARSAFDRWQTRQPSAQAGRPELLLDPNGQVLQEAFAQIMSERDNRPIYLAE